MDSRKIEILNAIINSYIDSPNPVGSRTISKDFNLGVSSATIRNEMADLEDLGYLNKPHTSAGRIPSVKAYRFFVDELQKNSFIESNENEPLLLNEILEYSNGINDIFKTATKILADSSGYISYLVSFKRSNLKVKFVKLILIESGTVLLLLVGDTGIVEKHFFKCERSMNEEDLENINVVLNNYLVGVNLIEVDSLNVILSGKMAGHSSFITEVIQTIADFNKGSEKIDFFYDGIKNVFNFQDEIDKNQVIEIINLMENKYLANVLNNYDKDLTVIIGDETGGELMKDNSLIVSSFKDIKKEMSIKLGILGPMRMDYKNQIQTVKMVSNNLELALKKW